MGAETEFLVPQQRRAIRIQGTGATVGGAVNTNVVAFTSAAAAWQGTIVGTVGATHVAPTVNSANWINVVNDTDHATTFKFNRAGVYRATISADSVAAYAAGAQLGITLDQALALYTVAAGTVSALSDTVLGYLSQIDTIADVSIPFHVTADVYVTKAMAGGAQAADAAGVQGVGVLRFIANDNANGVVSTAFVVASIRATIAQVNDNLAGG